MRYIESYPGGLYEPTTTAQGRIPCSSLTFSCSAVPDHSRTIRRYKRGAIGPRSQTHRVSPLATTRLPSCSTSPASRSVRSSSPTPSPAPRSVPHNPACTNPCDSLPAEARRALHRQRSPAPTLAQDHLRQPHLHRRPDPRHHRPRRADPARPRRAHPARRPRHDRCLLQRPQRQHLRRPVHRLQRRPGMSARAEHELLVRDRRGHVLCA